jgi:peptide deformylase
MIAILNYPNPRLHIKAEPVTDVTAPEIQQIIDDMFFTLANTDNCAGLAATQLDFIRPKAITVLNDYSEDATQPRCLINPEIIERSGEMTEDEGCMSVYSTHIHAAVSRAARVKVRAMDREGKIFEYEATGFIAKLIQHEVDHLNGIIYLQRLSTLKRARIDEKIRKLILQNK